jgi:mediator of RNA polymerase II transcription subunit 18
MATKPSGQSYEYVLYGSVSPANHAALLHRLRGLCTGATTGGSSFTDREITYKIEAGAASSKVKVRQSLDAPDAPWLLVYHGQLELGDSSRAAGVRTVVSAACSHTLTDCLSYLGFMPIGELVLKGQVFRKAGVKVLVFTMYQPSDTTDLDSIQPFSQNYLVELTAFASSSQDRAIDELRNFAEYLKPYPTLPIVLTMSNPPLWRERRWI